MKSRRIRRLFSVNAKRFFYGLISDKHLPDLAGQLRLHTGSRYPEFLAKELRNNFAYVNPILLPCPFLIKRERPTAVMLRKLSLDVKIRAYRQLIHGGKRYFELFRQSGLSARIELYYKIWRIYMLAKQAPSFVLKIHVPYRLEKRERLRLILKIL